LGLTRQSKSDATGAYPRRWRGVLHLGLIVVARGRDGLPPVARTSRWIRNPQLPGDPSDPQRQV